MTAEERDTECHHRQAVADAVAGLRHGAVGLNEHAGYIGAVPQLPWGAYPGSTPEAIGSGVGFVSNTALLPRPEQGLLRAAFRAPPKSFFTATHKTRADAYRACIA